jgi:hypothetical protein
MNIPEVEEEEVENTQNVQPTFLTLNAFVEMPTLNAFDEHEFETVDGVFSSMPKVNIIEKTSKFVKFTIPYGVEEVTIFTALLDNVIHKVVE